MDGDLVDVWDAISRIRKLAFGCAAVTRCLFTSSFSETYKNNILLIVHLCIRLAMIDCYFYRNHTSACISWDLNYFSIFPGELAKAARSDCSCRSAALLLDQDENRSDKCRLVSLLFAYLNIQMTMDLHDDWCGCFGGRMMIQKFSKNQWKLLACVIGLDDPLSVQTVQADHDRRLNSLDNLDKVLGRPCMALAFEDNLRWTQRWLKLQVVSWDRNWSMMTLKLLVEVCKSSVL